MKKKIGVIGSGVVAQTLGTGFIANGNEVMLSSRSPEKLHEWKKQQGNKARVGTFAEAAEFGDIILLAVKGKNAEDALSMVNKGNLTGKTVIDACNPIDESGIDNGVLKFFTSQNESLMELLQVRYPEANFVKAFNSVGNPHMVNPSFESKPTMFICGNNAEAKKEVGEILDAFGWETEDFGSAASARPIESLCVLWCIPGMTGGGWNHAFKLLKK